jgi:hypothetical protein
MNNNRCNNCGFLNFVSASECKRCKAALVVHSEFGENYAYDGYGAGQAVYPTMSGYQQPAYTSPYFHTPIAPLPRASKNSSTNAALFGLLGVAVAIALGIGVLWKFGNPGSARNGWQVYKPKDESFSVMMPATPVDSVASKPTDVGTLDVHLSLADMGDQAYLVGYSDYPDSFKSLPPETVLAGAENGAITESGSTLLSKKSITIDGHPGVELVLQPPNSAATGVSRAYSRLYWVAPRMYILFAGGAETSEVNQRSIKFLDSFALLKHKF